MGFTFTSILPFWPQVQHPPERPCPSSAFGQSGSSFQKHCPIAETAGIFFVCLSTVSVNGYYVCFVSCVPFLDVTIVVPELRRWNLAAGFEGGGRRNAVGAWSFAWVRVSPRAKGENGVAFCQPQGEHDGFSFFFRFCLQKPAWGTTVFSKFSHTVNNCKSIS